MRTITHVATVAGAVLLAAVGTDGRATRERGDGRAEERPAGSSSSRSGDRGQAAATGAGSGPSSGSSAGSLAFTGVEVGGVAAAGLGLLVAGRLLVRTSRRRTA